MKRGWTAAVGVLGLSIALASALLAPLQATATDSDLKHAYAFKVDASNGYSILALASSQRADGSGEVVLFAGGTAGDATYVAPARVTATRIDADLGGLGVVALDVVPSGHATFRHEAAPANRWTGNLTVDLPGRSEVPLTGTGVGATLTPSCFQEGGGRLRC